jgi:tetratricopeptide (TPR) repeat protein
VILLLTLTLYWPALDYPFVYDDVDQIANNPRVNTWSGLVSGFREGVWGFDESKGDGFYRPLFLSVVTAGQMLSSGDPLALHAASLMLHLLNVLLLWRVARALGAAPAARLVGCGLFALHPIQIQSIVWASAISDPLMATFGLAALLGTARWQRDGQRRHQLLAVAFFGLACLTIERSFVIAVPLMLLSFYRPMGEGGAWSIPPIRKLFSDGLAIAAPVVGAVALRTRALERTSLGAQLDIAETLLTVPSVVLRYLFNLLLPARLALAYPERMLAEASWTSFALPLVICLIVAGCLFHLSRRRALRQFLLACFVSLVALPLCVGLLPGYALVQDRYLYLPIAFLFLWLGDLVAVAFEGERAAMTRRVALLALACWSMLLLGVHRSNLLVWRSEIALYQRSVESAPDNPPFLMNLSNALTRSERPERDCRLLQRAVEALAVDPRRGTPALTHFNLGNCLRRRGALEEALAEYDAAQRLARGNFPQAYENAAVTQLDLGNEEATLVLARVLSERWPNTPAGFKLAGIVHARRGQFQLAAEQLRHARDRAPADPEIQKLLSRVEAAGP